MQKMTKMTAEMFGANTPIVPDETDAQWMKENSAKQMPPTIIEIGGVKYQRVDEEPESKPETLYDIIYEWHKNLNQSDEISFKIDDLVFFIEEWLPKEQSSAGSQNVYVECTVEGFNDCLQKIKSKLR